MFKLNRNLTPAVAIVLSTSLSSPADAELIIYSYVGNPFTNISSGFPVFRVSIWFTVDSSIIFENSHIVLDSYNSKTINYFYFSNGYQNLSNNPNLEPNFWIYTSSNISFDTDSSGNISGNWAANSSRAHGNQYGLSLYDAISSTNSLDGTSSLGGHEAIVSNNPGTWTRSTSSVIPLPGGFTLFGSAFGGLLFSALCSRGKTHLHENTV